MFNNFFNTFNCCTNNDNDSKIDQEEQEKEELKMKEINNEDYVRRKIPPHHKSNSGTITNIKIMYSDNTNSTIDNNNDNNDSDDKDSHYYSTNKEYGKILIEDKYIRNDEKDFLTFVKLILK